MNLEQNFYCSWLNKKRSSIKPSREMYMSYNPFDSDSPSFGGLGGSGDEEDYWKDAWKIKAPKPVVPTIIKDFPESGFQFHFHENNEGIITGEKIKPWGIEKKDDEFRLDNYRIALGDLYADRLGIKRIK